jgi:hypothetical protein
LQPHRAVSHAAVWLPGLCNRSFNADKVAKAQA